MLTKSITSHEQTYRTILCTGYLKAHDRYRAIIDDLKMSNEKIDRSLDGGDDDDEGVRRGLLEASDEDDDDTSI